MKSDKLTIRIEKFLADITKVLTRLGTLKQSQFERRIESLSGNIEAFSSRTVKSGLVGITSSGKSSLLNVVLGTGEKILKEQSRATTNMIVFCSKKEEPSLEIHFDGSEPFVKNGPKVLTESIWKYTSEDENPHNKMAVKYIKLGLPTFLIDADIEIADTPGLDAYGLKEHEDLTLREFLPQADMIIFLSSVRSPMKEADRKILNKIMDADQRIVFVQTCKGAVVQSNYGDDGAETVEELLGKYKAELKKDIKPYLRLKDSPIVQVETTQAIKYFKSGNKHDWQESGMEEFVHVINGVANQLQDEFSLKNLRKTVSEVNALNTLIKNTIQEEGEKEGSIDEQTGELNILKDYLQKMMQTNKKIVTLWRKRLDFNASFNKYKLELSRTFGDRYDFNPLHDKEFINAAQAIGQKTQIVKNSFLDELDAAKEQYREYFTKLGLDVRRTDIQQLSKSAFFLPNVQKKRVSDTLGSSGSGGGLFSKQQKKVKDEYIDKKKFIEDLRMTMEYFFTPLINHLEWWEKTMNYSFIEPLQKKIDSFEDDITNVQKGASYSDTQHTKLTGITDDIDAVLRGVSDICDTDITGRKLDGYARSLSGRAADIRGSESKNIFLQLGTRLFEGMFHDYYLNAIGQITENPSKSIVVIGDNRDAAINFLRRLMRLDSKAALSLEKSKMPFSVNAKNKIPGISNIALKGEFASDFSLYFLDNESASYEAAMNGGLFDKVDVIQVMINDLHRVASALVDVVERNLFFDVMTENRSRLLLTYPGGAHFQKERLHIMVDEAVAEINNLFAPDPMRWFIYENFEVRYSYFYDISYQCRVPAQIPR